MSLSAEKTNIKKEMKAGVHLAIISDMKRYIDSSKNQIIQNGEVGIVVTFSNGNNEKHEQVYWVGKGNDGKEKYFTKMCVDAGIDMTKTPLSKKEAIGKRVWIAIREIYTLINHGEEIKKDITGKEVVDYFVFNTYPVFDPERIPTHRGDPAKNGGIPTDDFVGFKMDGQSVDEAIAENTLDVSEIVDELINTETNDSPEIQSTEMPTFESNTITPIPNFGDDMSPDDNF